MALGSPDEAALLSTPRANSWARQLGLAAAGLAGAWGGATLAYLGSGRGGMGPWGWLGWLLAVGGLGLLAKGSWSAIHEASSRLQHLVCALVAVVAALHLVVGAVVLGLAALESWDGTCRSGSETEGWQHCGTGE